MNLMELLLQVDARLRPLVGADENTWQTVLEEAAAGPRRPAIPPEVEPRAMLAGLLLDIETACRMLRESLGVQFTVATRVDVKAVVSRPDEQV